VGQPQGLAEGGRGAAPRIRNQDPELRADLAGVEYGYSAKGEIQLEKKEDMKRRGLASPDIGDALALTFAQPVAALWDWDRPRGPVFCINEDTVEDWDPNHDA
jgi:hypothetical protein